MDVVTVTVVGAAYGGTIAFRLARTERRSTSDLLLAAMFVVLGLASLSIALQRSVGDPLVARLLTRVEYALGFGAGPLLLLYVGSVTGGRGRLSSRLHFLPSIIALLAPSYGGSPMFGAPIELLMAHQFIYTGFSLSSFWRSTVDSDHPHRIWCRYVLFFMVAMHLTQLVRLFGPNTSAFKDLIPLFLSTAVLGLGVFLIRVGTRPKLTRNLEAATGVGALKLDRELLRRLDKLITEDQVYRDAQLTLPALAERLVTTPHELSRVLNGVAGESFNDFVNRYRVEESKQRLLDSEHEHFSIEGIALMSGFGSRSAFYEAFRRSEGMTPGEYRRQNPREND